VTLQLDRPALGDDLATTAVPRRAAPVPRHARPVFGDDLDITSAPRRAAPIPRLVRSVAGDDLATATAPRRAAPGPDVGKPVFSDDSGHRAAAVRWAGWGICLLGVLLCAALGLTLRAHVSLPDLERQLFGSSAGRQAATVPSDSAKAGAARPTDLRASDSDRVGATGLPQSERTPTAVATSDTHPTAGIPTGEAAPAPVTADPLATVPAVPGSSASKATPLALEKTKTRNPHAATPTPGGHGRPNAVS
jgi:hypothetical protein